MSFAEERDEYFQFVTSFLTQVLGWDLTRATSWTTERFAQVTEDNEQLLFCEKPAYYVLNLVIPPGTRNRMGPLAYHALRNELIDEIMRAKDCPDLFSTEMSRTIAAIVEGFTMPPKTY